jgi:organic radical activating enzyme
MFGKNTLVKQDYKKKEKLYIKSIFKTIQGEGPFSGYSSIFIRFGYCNLACFFCDTDFETDLKEQTVLEVLEEVKKLAEDKIKLVVITGGEPFVQLLLSDLVSELLKENFIVQIETAGSLYQKLDFDNENLHIVCSPKTGKLNPEIENYINYYKYIISFDNYSDEDGLPILSTQFENKPQKIARPKNLKKIYISPMDQYNLEINQKNLKACVEICLKYNYILSLQVHKIIGVD